MTKFVLNGKLVEVENSPDEMLLLIIRDALKLKGTKYGCGAAMCGACTIHVDGQAMFSCQMSLSDVEGAGVASASEGLGGRTGPAMRLLPVRPDHAGRCTSVGNTEPQPRRYRGLHEREPLPLRDLQPDLQGGRTCREGGVRWR